MSEWYLKDPTGATSGPFATQAIQQWISAGQVAAEHHVCAVNTSQWVPVTEVPTFLSVLVAARGGGPAGAAPPQSRASHPSAPQGYPSGSQQQAPQSMPYPSAPQPSLAP